MENNHNPNVLEMLNRVEIRGRVGRCTVKTVGREDDKVANMSVVTDSYYKDRYNQQIVETMWWNVAAFADKIEGGTPESIDKGTAVHVVGRMRSRVYTDKDGNEKRMNEVVASKVEILHGYEY